MCDYASGFSIDFKLVKNSDFILQGRSLEVQLPIVGANGVVNNKDLLTNFSLDVFDEDNSNGGLVIYEKMQDLVDEYIHKYEKYKTDLDLAQQHNKKVDRNLAILRYTGQALAVAATIASGGTTAVVGSAFIIAIKEYAPDLVEKKNGAYVVKHEKIIGAAEKIIGEGVKHYANSTWKKADLPKAPMAPTAMFSEMYFKGRMTTIDSKSGPKLMTPGTYGTSNTSNVSDQHSYPIYNDALGVFALLETPELEMSEIKNKKTEVLLSKEYPIIYQNSTNNVGVLNFLSVKQNKFTQFKLKNDLKYVFNPALPIKKYTIEAGFEVHSTFEKTTTVPPSAWFPMEEGLANRTLPYYNVNTNSVWNNFEKNEAIVSDTLDYSTIYVPIDALKSLVYSSGYQTIWENPGLNYPNLIDADVLYAAQYDNFKSTLEDTVVIAKVIDQIVKSNKYFLKLIVKIEFDDHFSDGEPHEYTYIYTYEIPKEKIDLNTENPLNQYLYESYLHVNQYSEDLTLENVNFNGSEVEGCKLNGNTYLCKAWNNITLQGNTQVGVGYNVKAEAGNEIYVIAEAVVPNEMTLSIVPVLDYNSPMPSATSTEVKTFCMDINQYKARLSNKSSIVDTNEVPIIEGNNTSLSKQPFSFSLYPNPASGTTTVEIKGFETSNARISVFDITGKELNIKIERQGNKFELDISTLSKGIYLVKVSTFGESKTKQLIIQ